MDTTAAGKPNWANRTLWTGDNLDIMRGMNSASVDLIYLDPPFNSSKTYAAPADSTSAGASFGDTWTPSDLDAGWRDEATLQEPALLAVFEVAAQAHGVSMESYLVMMAVRLLEMRRLLRDTGSIYLHCDPTASHYLKLVMDCVFGKDQYRNEIVWHYGKMSNPGRNFPRNHDSILRYTRTDSYFFRTVRGADSEYRTRYARYLTGNRVLYGSVKHSRDKLILRRVERLIRELGRDLRDDDVLFDFDREFKVQSDVMYVPIIKGNSSERTGYPTQKPLELLHKIVESSTNEGDIVLDPFCGCATACIAAEQLGRQWAGIDLSPLAANLVKRRLREQQGLFYDVVHRADVPKRTDMDRAVEYSQASARAARTTPGGPDMTAVDDILIQMREQRKTTQERLQGVTEEQMLAPTTYGERSVDVRFMFYRFIAHEVEHTVQLAKTLHMLGAAQGEAQLILKSLQVARGELEGMMVGLSDEDLDREPAEGEWSARQVIDHILQVEEVYTRRIEQGIEAAR